MVGGQEAWCSYLKAGSRPNSAINTTKEIARIAITTALKTRIARASDFQKLSESFSIFFVKYGQDESLLEA